MKENELQKELAAFGCEENAVRGLLRKLGLVEVEKPDFQVGDIWELEEDETFHHIIFFITRIDGDDLIGPSYDCTNEHWGEEQEPFNQKELAGCKLSLIYRAETAPKKRRGRPPKKRRGRPPKKEK
jgi:hypothetical protein